MANYLIAFEITMGHEGSYSNNPVDKGGETYMGIARKFHPNWNGWVIIDEYKQKGNVNLSSGECTNKLRESVLDFYKEQYWDKFNGDQITDERIAQELFDTSVNMGISTAVKFIQRSLNCLNRNGVLYPDLLVDGQIGSKTLFAMQQLNKDDIKLLFKIMNVLQGAKYVDIMASDPTQEAFCRGWFNRVSIYKE